MTKTVAILQSNYIPWKGYFDLINRADEFILYDDMQYTRRDWRNRNKIKTESGTQWLTLSVEVKGKFLQKINQTKVANVDWADQHWQKILNAYRKTDYFVDYKELIYGWYMEAKNLTMLSDINRFFIEKICQLLAIDTTITCSSDYALIEGKSERLLQLCLDAGGSTYLSGPAAKDYLDEAIFIRQGVDIQWMDYSGYQQYHQCRGEFEHGVTILDVIFNCGPDSRKYVLRERDHD